MWTGIGIVIIMVLFPPWIGTKGGGPMVFVGYSAICKQPTYKSASSQTSRSYMTTPDGEKKVLSERTYFPKSSYSQAQINYHLLYLQIMLVLLITVASILTLAQEPASQSDKP